MKLFLLNSQKMYTKTIATHDIDNDVILFHGNVKICYHFCIAKIAITIFAEKKK